MSGSLSYISDLFGTSLGSADSLLGALYGKSTGGQDPAQALAIAERNETQDIKVTAAQPEVQRALAAFTKAVGSAKTVGDLLANPAVMNVLLTASGMKDQIGYTALATKALTSKLTDPNALVNQLADTRWKTLAQTYDFASLGLSGIKKSTALLAITNAYAKATWQSGEDAVTPGLSNALSFKAQASKITSVDQVLGNPTVRTVVTTALGIPQEIAFQTLNAQEQAISTRLDVKQFQDPKFVDAFAQRYLIANNAAAAANSSSVPDLVTLAVQGKSLFV